MNALIKNLGVIVIILGALALILPSFLGFISNTTLAIGGVLLFTGLILHVILTRKATDL
ncbi:MAG: hypothetical protein KA397_04925 [Paludibacteraceae bacterium]|nr:hypothetical protein [Paludibacteraceae bacterium]MBP6283885.1 hypothetical protein [Paludibacteraceae bacterium]